MQLADVRLAVDPAALAKASSVLGQAVRSRQIAYVGGRLCAELALSEFGARQEVEIARGPAGDPLWPSGWIGSISHSPEIAVAAVAEADSCIAIGIDVEPLLPPADFVAVLSMCACDAERRLLEGHVNATVTATVLFAAKEAYFKAVFPVVGRFVDFPEVSVDMAGGVGDRVCVYPNNNARSTLKLPRAYGRWRLRDGSVFVCVAIYDT